MTKILAEKIHDNRFLRLMRNMLRAGYLEDWVWNATLSGAPQGGTVSPVLSNIYLHKLDDFVGNTLKIIENSIRRNIGRWLRGRNQGTCVVVAGNR